MSAPGQVSLATSFSGLFSFSKGKVLVKGLVSLGLLQTGVFIYSVTSRIPILSHFDAKLR